MVFVYWLTKEPVEQKRKHVVLTGGTMDSLIFNMKFFFYLSSETIDHQQLTQNFISSFRTYRTCVNVLKVCCPIQEQESAILACWNLPRYSTAHVSDSAVSFD